MAKLKVHAGDIPTTANSITVSFSAMTISDPMGGGFFGKSYTFTSNDIESVELATEESAVRLGGAAGWGTVGAIALGPVGLLAGLVLGGKGKDITFIVLFKDGRKMLATTDSKTYTKIQALAF